MRDTTADTASGGSGSAVGLGDRVNLEATALVAGGDAIARDADGKVVFVSGALAGERVQVRITEVKRDFSRAAVEEILSVSPDRVSPSCPEVERGCGGCDLAHVERTAQPSVKAKIVADALRRLGRVEDPVVRAGTSVTQNGFRTTVRAAVVNGRAGFRRGRSHEVIHVERCTVAHPELDELLISGNFGEASEVTLRIGAATGERLALVSPTACGVQLPNDVTVVGGDELEAKDFAGQHWYHEVIDGRRFRISATSFFQTSAVGAGLLVDVVRRMAADVLGRPGVAIDAYGGVGLFASCLGSPIETPLQEARQFVVIERGASSVADARHNLRDRHARVLGMSVDDFTPRDLVVEEPIVEELPVEDLATRGSAGAEVDLVIADPSRSGLGQRGVDALAATEAHCFVLVSCDPASLGRDTRLLGEAGFRFVEAELVDMFPDTHHVEVVSRFDC